MYFARRLLAAAVASVVIAEVAGAPQQYLVGVGIGDITG
jgi:hypothetical protein